LGSSVGPEKNVLGEEQTSNAHVADLKCHVSVDRVKIGLGAKTAKDPIHRGAVLYLN